MAGESSFGAWLKGRRKALDLTQRDLAAQTGYSLETIVKIETGERRPSKQAAERLASYLGVPVEERAAFVQFARGAADEEGAAHSGGGFPPFGIGGPWVSALRRPSNLPAPPNTFIGRAREVATVTGLLSRPGVRILTLTGPPGIGKTRLSIEVAGRLRDEFAQGVTFVALAPIHDPPLIVSAIAGALDVRESARRPLLDSLKEYLRDKQILLVLDNFEQVTAAAPLVADLLGAAPRLKVLISSRAVLHLYGEHEFAVPPLALPDTPGSLPPLATLREWEGVALFVERAEAVQPGFTLTESNAATVIALCRQLDGLPLAIELAAARSKFFTPEALLARLGAAAGRLDLLTGGPQDRPSRQRTLRDAIAWSYDLLAPAEQTLFRRLAVFVGGATPEAVAAVGSRQRAGGSDERAGGGGPDLGAEDDSPAADTQHATHSTQHTVLDGLASLVDKSLVQREAPEGAERFGMLETIREYAWERMEAGGEAAEVREAHTAYYLALAEQAAPALRGPDQADWLDRLEREHDNLRAAQRWAAEAEDGETALRLVGALGWFWFRRGYLTEGREQITRALNSAGPERTPARAMALYWAGRSAWRQGDHTEARMLHDESLAIFDEHKDRRGRALVLNGLGMMAGDEGDFAAERALYEESLALGQALGDGWIAAQARQLLGLQAATQGDYAAARAHQEGGLAMFRALGDKRGIAHALSGLGPVALEADDPQAARALYTEALAIFRDLHDKSGIAGVLVSLGEVARVQGDYAAAVALLDESLILWQELGDKEGMAMPLHNLAHAVLHLGDTTRAGALFAESLDLFERMGIKFGVAICLAGLAGVAGARGQANRAARLFGAADTLLGSLGAHLQAADLADYEHHLAAARAALDPATWATGWAEGSTLSLAQAITYAIERTTDDGR
jgi:predicted ATPase/transcriptional regulator with XRE-family HTH domain